MARIAGVDIPKDKRVEIALTYIYGIGKTLSNQMLETLKIDPNTRVKNLTESEISKLNGYIQDSYRVEGDLRRDINQNVKRLVEIGSYRGLRHRRKLPVRGQRTRTNARTRKGKRKTVGSSKVQKPQTLGKDKK